MMSDFMDRYEQQEAENVRTWIERARRKSELYDEASRVLETFSSHVKREPLEHKGYGWAIDRPELALKYAESLIKLGQYWDGERIWGAVDAVADKTR